MKTVKYFKTWLKSGKTAFLETKMLNFNSNGTAFTE